MRLARVRRFLTLVVFGALGMAACAGEGPSDLRWEINFKCAGDAQLTSSINVRLLKDMCGGADTIYEANLQRGEAGPAEVIPPGNYFVEGTALDANGATVALACRAQRFPTKVLSIALSNPQCDLQVGDPGDGGDVPFDSSMPGGDMGDASPPTPPPDASMSTCAVNAGNCACDSHNGHTYLVCPDAASWADARKGCRSHGADLVIINDAEENAYVAAKLGGSTHWIGADDRGDDGINYAGIGSCMCDKVGDEGKWFWVDGPGNKDHGAALCELNNKTCEPSGGSYTNWASGQPDNAFSAEFCYPSKACPEGEDCASMGTDGAWSDMACANKLTYVCETY